MTVSSDDTPAARLARWTSTDAAIGSAAEVEQLEAQLAEARREVADLPSVVSRRAVVRQMLGKGTRRRQITPSQ